MKIKLFSGCTLALILLLISPDYLAADRSGGPIDFILSPTTMATGGLFSADMDNYIDAAHYTDAEMRKEFVFVYFNQSFFGTFGYARYFGNLYLAGYYGGNLFQGYYAPAYQQNEYFSLDLSSSKKFKYLVSGKPEINDTGTCNNNRYALFMGIKNMGFRISYASTLGRFSERDMSYKDGMNQYYAKSFDTALGWAIPELQWGLSKPLTKNGIQPAMGLNLAFFRNYERYERYNSVTFAAEKELVSYSENFIQPSLSLKLGGYTFFSKPGFYTDVDLDYTLSFRIYNNDYNYQDSSGINRINSIKGINDMNGLSQDSYIGNMLAPAIGLCYTGMSRVDLKASLFLPLTFLSSGKTEKEIKPGNTKGELQKDGRDISLFYFRFSPKIVFGFQFQAFPGRLDFNVGGIIQFASIARAHFTEESWTNGAKTPGTYKDKTIMTLYGYQYVLGDFMGEDQRAALNAGITFRFNEYVVLDAMTGVNGSNAANIFGTGANSLTSYSSILLTLKI